MRHVSCFDQVQRVKGFVSEFYSAPRTPEEASSAVRDFVEVGVASVSHVTNSSGHMTSQYEIILSYALVLVCRRWLG